MTDGFGPATFEYTKRPQDARQPQIDRRRNGPGCSISRLHRQATDARFTQVFRSPSGDPAEFARTPAKGLMIVTQDDKNALEEANLLKVKF